MRINEREKIVLAGGVVLLALFALFQFVLAPHIEAKKRLERKIVRRQQVLEQVVELQHQYRQLAAGGGSVDSLLARRPSSFSLFSFLEKAADMAAVKSRITSMKPSGGEVVGPYRLAMVSMRLEKLPLAALVRFLKRIERPGYVVGSRRLAIRTSGQDKNLLDVSLDVVTYVSEEK